MGAHAGLWPTLLGGGTARAAVLLPRRSTLPPPALRQRCAAALHPSADDVGALGAALRNPGQEVWLIWGDGSSAYSLAEFDTFLRHNLPVIAVVGTDASWAQIAREQVEMLGSACGTELRRTAYHKVAEGYGGKGILVETQEDLEPTLEQAKNWCKEGFPVLINIQLSTSDFRKGSISM